ncbi:MAG: hypothetical protein ACKV19_10300, partial [Verrucomicrobiales bacterium]
MTIAAPVETGNPEARRMTRQIQDSLAALNEPPPSSGPGNDSPGPEPLPPPPPAALIPKQAP